MQLPKPSPKIKADIKLCQNMYYQQTEETTTTGMAQKPELLAEYCGRAPIWPVIKIES